MKGIFLTLGENPADNQTGINKKILNQVKAFNNQELDCSIVNLYRKIDDLFMKKNNLAFFSKGLPKWKYSSTLSNVDFIYFRRPNYMSWQMRRMLKKIKRVNSKIKIIMEIPTYPYDQEILGNPLTRPFYPIDVFNRKRLSGCVDRISILNDDIKELWGIPTLQIDNGINMEDYSVRKPVESDTIHCIAVAMFMPWHGYERVINGLYDYYNETGYEKKNIVIHMIGKGSELEKYKKLVFEKNLRKHFMFHGFLTKDEMEPIYDQCRLALCSFGAYKIDLDVLKNLKSREYLAKGLPIIAGCDMDIFHKGFYYYCEFPNNESNVDLKRVVSFYESIYLHNDETEVITEIREFAEKYFSMETCMQEVVNYLKD